MENLKTIWSKGAKEQLKVIYEYLKYEKKTPQGATNVRNDILNAGKEIAFAKQYQKDEVLPKYRRIIVRHYKLMYKEENGTIIILRIFNTHQGPKRLLKDLE